MRYDFANEETNGPRIAPIGADKTVEKRVGAGRD
jgi:hypothetical protein